MRSDRWMLLAAVVVALLSPLTGVRAEPVVGAGVGNADLLVAEGTRLYNEKSYDEARDRFLKATRAAPATLSTYLSLARSYAALKDSERAAAAYRAFIKSSPESVERGKAQSELGLCEKQLKAVKLKAGKQKAPESPSFSPLKASFFEALDKGALSGPGSASEKLTSLVAAGYAAPDLGDMAAKLAHAAEAAADQIFQRMQAHQKTDGAVLRKAGTLYLLALDFGAAPAKQGARAAFLEGMALLQDSKASQAEGAFEEASKKDPADTEARFYRGLARYASGDKAGALKLLQADLPTDKRTSVLEMAIALEGPSEQAAAELQKLLFARRYAE